MDIKYQQCRSQDHQIHRSGKALIFVILAMPMIVGIIGLVIDGSLILHEYRETQHATDAAATAAAYSYSQGESSFTTTLRARDMVQTHNELPEANVELNSPPLNGPYSGDLDYFEVFVSRESDTLFMQLANRFTRRSVRTRAVAGYKDSTVRAAITILDPDPLPITITGLPISLPSLPNHHLGGLEVLGLGQVRVEGAVVVNNEWGGVDENGDLAGASTGLRNALRCTPILPLTKLLAEDIYVVGGVDTPDNYGHLDGSQPSPLVANKSPIQDPLRGLPVPSLASDPVNVNATPRGVANIVNIPLLSPPIVLEPGVYDWIHVVTGPVQFEPGIYVIRGRNPATGVSLLIGGNSVNMNRVMFYITDNASFTPVTGHPDRGEDSSSPPPSGLTNLVPSAVINGTLLNTQLSPLTDAASPFNGVSLFQARNDRRPIVLVSEQLLGSSSVSGTIYSKWGNVIVVANGRHDLGIVAGSCRIVSALDSVFRPSQTFAPPQEVFLVE